jgi:hypothetical protein
VLFFVSFFFLEKKRKESNINLNFSFQIERYCDEEKKKSKLCFIVPKKKNEIKIFPT